MHECFGATIVLGTPLISSLFHILKLLVLLLHLFYLETGVFVVHNICGLRYGKLVMMGLKGIKEV